MKKPKAQYAYALVGEDGKIVLETICKTRQEVRRVFPAMSEMFSVERIKLRSQHE